MLGGRRVVGSSGGCTADGRPSEKYLSVFCFFLFRSSAFVHCTCAEDTHRLERGLHMINS